MDILFDVNIVVDLCARREPFYSQALQVEEFCRAHGMRVRLYTGSVQTIHFVLAAALADHDKNSGVEMQRRGFYLREARQLLEVYSSDILWQAALSEDGQVFDNEDPEDAQLIKAVDRLGKDAVLLTRDEGLLNRCTKAVTPSDFLLRSTETDKQPAIAFCDLAAQLDTFRPQMEKAILDVVESTAYIKGPALDRLETELSDYLDGSVESICCSSGTDALLIALMALDVHPGDEVIIPDFTFIATGEVVSFLGAVPVFCDVDPVTYNLDPSRIEALISDKTIGIIPVSIFGQCADMDAINTIADRHGLWVMEDAAQSFGAEYKGRKSCTMSKVATTSFFPAKPLGCYGDGGAIFTADTELAGKMRTILNHGQERRYHHSMIGLNGRMDTLQAAVVSVKLRNFDRELELRNKVAQEYTRKLSELTETPRVLEHNTSVWAQYTLVHKRRDHIRSALSNAGIPTAVHYPVPLHKQQAFAYLKRPVDCPVTEKLSEQVFSLPMHPFLKEPEISRIADTIRKVLQ
ncbi:DegT/DnrJ/EryC1/StrS family aminotransferase [Marispirochaeta sp.]|uniref:DegT/DnrJ/EryC1/StrS family aminotransferase n=1 Tax=Marispirochaeta sp. TaxID=2038653 RepID=UPI0029C866AE|nr:DegT/DnrJ/EryC1/StrS family aminotransferase [Marispirochaeta sp.]